MEYNEERILKQLETEKYATAVQIAKAVGISERTVRIRIGELNRQMEGCGAQIRSRPNMGFWLEISVWPKYEQWKEKQRKRRIEMPATSADRVTYLLAYLLNHDNYVKVDDLSEFLYVSRNTLSADLKQAECVLNLYHLQIKRRPNYGICVTGSEFDRRICIAACLLRDDRIRMQTPKQQEDMRRLADIMKKILMEFCLQASESGFESLILHAYVANGRIRRGHLIQISPDQKKELCANLGRHALEAARAAAAEISSQMKIDYAEEEILYLAVHISGKTSPDTARRKSPGLVISSRIDELVLEMLEAVYEGNGIDFRDNLELRMSLNQHMVPFDIRMKYAIPMKNPILDKIKQEYAFAYTIAATACTALCRHYGREIPEDELGYFAVLFALALEKQGKTIDRKNIVVVCVSGRGSSQLFLYRYKQAFGKYIDQIYECSVFELEDFDFAGKNIDYLFTTVPLNLALPVPVFEISLFPDREEIDSYQRLFERGSSAFLYSYYDKRLFIPNLAGRDKEDILRKICAHIASVRPLPDGFLEAVLERERMGQTDFGNLVAISHPCRIMTREKFVATAILEEPVWWGHNEVQVVLLAALGEEKDEDIERFYQATTDLVFNEARVRRLIESRDYETFISLLSGEADEKRKDR